MRCVCEQLSPLPRRIWARSRLPSRWKRRSLRLQKRMAVLRLHLDGAASIRTLYQELRRGHDVSRTPNEWVGEDASDEEQLLRATAHGRAIFSFNASDVVPLASSYPQHAGIVLGYQSKWSIDELVLSLDRLLSELEAQDIVGQVIWLEPVPR